MTLVYQDGLFGIEGGPIEAYLPVIIFAIVFGLSMDYEIFLVSRMHEELVRSENKDPSRAVRVSLAHTGSVITAAGSIMIVIFAAFMLSPERLLQQTGFGMAAAIFVDAVIVRCLIVRLRCNLWAAPGGCLHRWPGCCRRWNWNGTDSTARPGRYRSSHGTHRLPRPPTWAAGRPERVAHRT